MPVFLGFPGGSDGKQSTYNARDLALISRFRRAPGGGNGYDSSILAWRIPWTESLAGYSPQGCKDTTEQLLLWYVRAADARETAPWRQGHKRLIQSQPGEPWMPG